MWKADKLGYRGNTSYNKAYQGNELVWEKQPLVDNIFRLEAIEDSSIGLNSISSGWTVFQYSFNRVNWNDCSTATNISLNAGKKVYFRAKQTGNSADDDYTQFTMSGNVKAFGNIMVLYDYENTGNTTIAYECAFGRLFKDCTVLTTPPNLPATTLSGNSCYFEMFRNCQQLTTAPSLPATTISAWCYNGMFYSCQSLTTAPELPAITLEHACYEAMFAYCYRLTSAPELPATTLTNQCYSKMFLSCRSLATAPELPATTLAYRCYAWMFLYCRSLVNVPSILPATTLAEWCYYGMFDSCAFTTAPELPATNYEYQAYGLMFIDCSHLNYVKCLLITRTAISLNRWLSGVSPTGTFVKKTLSIFEEGGSGIPIGWIVENTPSPEPGPANDELWYSSTDGKIVTPYSTAGLPTIVSNTYVDGKGVIKFASVVTSIGVRSFYNRSNLLSIEIPNSVTSIGDRAFYNCSSLTSINIPNSVTSIGLRAFQNCVGLTFVEIPNSVTSIGESAFNSCSLASVNIPNSITRIIDWTFGNCTNLSSVTIPNSVTSIGGAAFFDCNSLPSIEIPNSVTTIGSNAFTSCDSLTSILYTGTIAQWNAVSKGEKWNSVTPATVVHCTDGDVPI